MRKSKEEYWIWLEDRVGNIARFLYRKSKELWGTTWSWVGNPGSPDRTGHGGRYLPSLNSVTWCVDPYMHDRRKELQGTLLQDRDAQQEEVVRRGWMDRGWIIGYEFCRVLIWTGMTPTSRRFFFRLRKRGCVTTSHSKKRVLPSLFRANFDGYSNIYTQN